MIARKVEKNKVLPFKAKLLDADGNLVTDIAAAPWVQVVYDVETTGPEADVAEQALSGNRGSEGDAFELLGDTWQFRLKTKN